MDKELETFVDAAWRDLKTSFSSLTREWLMEEAERQLVGEQPSGAPGMFLNKYLKGAGHIK
jgi:hypothetical protein